MKVRLPRLGRRPCFSLRAFHHPEVLSECRPFSPRQYSTNKPTPSNNNARWLSEIKARIGKCIMFGMDKEQTGQAAAVCKILGEDWRNLVAGREGFLVDRKRAGLLRQEVVWGEMDSMGHVNNVTYVRYAESARIGWAYNYALHIDPENKDRWTELWTPRGDGLILRSIRTAYKFPMTWPDSISVFHKLAQRPSPSDSHFILDVMIVSELHQRPAARCVEDIVVYDYKAGKKVEIRPFMMKAFEHAWEEQEDTKRKVEQRIRDIEEKVADLEAGTWNKVGAVEDMGSGT
ncbi:uncharacterized protein LY89DRAFT_596128 [Mollisia scopiformis]|uniref:Thioesterase/thiol ester dehydrase-isomerase n=1 Tax=Mollisia scopiformis TaxID=149040 RepID=A0A194WTG7_MOLSC|nr:uncharacterized protein LY89DRAFT_596128 [Mollisia scopiformis]KUJ10964.1 hypothetical protein LY89DRAFT_596128 [Mollisia scopiformis]